MPHYLGRRKSVLNKLAYVVGECQHDVFNCKQQSVSPKFRSAAKYQTITRKRRVETVSLRSQWWMINIRTTLYLSLSLSPPPHQQQEPFLVLTWSRRSSGTDDCEEFSTCLSSLSSFLSSRPVFNLICLLHREKTEPTDLSRSFVHSRSEGMLQRIAHRPHSHMGWWRGGEVSRWSQLLYKIVCTLLFSQILHIIQKA